MLPPWDVIAKLSVGRTVIKGGKTQARRTHNPEKPATAVAGKRSSLSPLRDGGRDEIAVRAGTGAGRRERKL